MPNIKCDVPDELKISTGTVVKLDWAGMSKEGRNHVTLYGIRRLLQDAYAGRGEKETDKEGKPTSTLTAKGRDEADALAAKRLAGLMSGELRTWGGVRVDAFTAECRTIVMRHLTKGGLKAKAIGKIPDLDTVKALCKKHKLSFVKVSEQASENVARAAAVADISLADEEI